MSSKLNMAYISALVAVLAIMPSKSAAAFDGFPLTLMLRR